MENEIIGIELNGKEVLEIEIRADKSAFRITKQCEETFPRGKFREKTKIGKVESAHIPELNKYTANLFLRGGLREYDFEFFKLESYTLLIDHINALSDFLEGQIKGGESKFKKKIETEEENMKTITSMHGLGKQEQLILTAKDLNVPALLVGQTGTGKTTLLRELAKIEKRKLIRVNLNGESGIPEVIGKYILVNGDMKWVDGPLLSAVRKGHWCVLDEINAALPEILFSLHSLLDDDRQLCLAEKEGEVVKAHKNFRLFATMNPPTEYAGTKELNKAFLSRFGIVINFPDYTAEGLLNILKYSCPDIKDEVHKISCDVYSVLKKERDAGNLYYYPSPRDFQVLSMLFDKTESQAGAIESAIINKMDEEEKVHARARLSSELGKVFEASDTKAVFSLYIGGEKGKVEALELKVKELTEYADKYKALESIMNKEEKAPF